MAITQIIVSAIGLVLIAWIVWYFWMWRGASVSAQVQDGMQSVDVTVKGGYQPASIMVKAGQPVRLNFTRREASTCGEEVVIPDFGKRAHLPENNTVAIVITPEKPGEYGFTCGMNMYRGRLIVT
ncbi:MAG TPA: cupredoxin domain-containing protein [Gammaproteobacteria bacterium]|nr:cupredoxin domain-containing protein [Gammaproteobacteria bacterium]